LEDSKIFLLLIVENQSLLNREPSIIGLTVLHGRLANLRIMDEAALALLAACSTSGIIFTMLGNVGFLGRRRGWRSDVGTSRHNFWLVVGRFLRGISHFVALIALLSFSLDRRLDFA
jgi:hypothetical protein